MEISNDDYAKSIESANLWKMKALVAGALASYFCSIAMYDGEIVDIGREIDLNAKRLLKLREVEGSTKGVRRELDKLIKYGQPKG